MEQWVEMEFGHICKAACSPQLTEALAYYNFFDILKGNDRYERSLRTVPGFIHWLHENVSPCCIKTGFRK